jgi:hypothetical protein
VTGTRNNERASTIDRDVGSSGPTGLDQFGIQDWYLTVGIRIAAFAAVVYWLDRREYLRTIRQQLAKNWRETFIIGLLALIVLRLYGFELSHVWIVLGIPESTFE